MCTFLRAVKKTGKTQQTSDEQPTRKTTKNEPTRTTKKHQTIIQNGSPEGVLGGPGASWPQGRPQKAPKIILRGLRGPNKFQGRARGGQSEISMRGFAPLKTDTPPCGWGGARRVRPLHFGAFSFENLAGACTGCKNKHFWVLGGR